MRKNIIQSKTEPNKNDIWLSEEGLKKYGKNGWEPLVRTPKFYYTGDGTKFLSDDGTYKEVSGGGGPVIIEYPNGSNEKIAVTDAQINAVKNGNVKIKLTMTGTTNYVILVPISIVILKEGAEIIVRSYFGENITDAILAVDFTNKTIFIPE